MEYKYLIHFIAQPEGIRQAIEETERFRRSQQKLEEQNIKTGQSAQQYAYLTGRSQQILNQIGLSHQKVSEILSTNTKVMHQYGTTTATVYTKVRTEAGQTYSLMWREGDKANAVIEHFGKALSRVAVVVPIWYFFRQAFMTVIDTIKLGVQEIINFDKAIQKAIPVIHNFSGSIDLAVSILKEKVYTLAKEAGVSVDKLTSAFYRFGTVGIPFQDAVAGMEASLKLAKVTFGDVDEIARVLAMTYRLLGDSMESSLSPQEKMSRIAGMIYELWRINAFEIDEFTQSLRNFVGMANISNFTIEQTIALLAALNSAGMKGSQAGTLLSTAVFKMTENLDKLATQLGLAVSEGESTFDVFMRIFDVLSQATTLDYEKMQVLSEVFGGLRGSKAVASLSSVRDLIYENLKISQEQVKAVEELNKRYEELKKTISTNVDVFTELRKQLGETFIRTITFSSDLGTAMQRVNKFFEGFSKLAFQFKPVDLAIKDIMSAYNKVLDIINVITEKLSKQPKLSIEEVDKMQEDLKLVYDYFQKIAKENIELIRPEEVEDYKSVRDLQENIYNITQKLTEILTEKRNKLIEEKKTQEDLLKDIERESELKLVLTELHKQALDYQVKLKEVEKDVSGLTEREKAYSIAVDRVKELVNMYNNLKTAEGKKIGEVAPIGFEETFNLLQDVIKGTKTEADILKAFPNIKDISKIDEYKEALKAVYEYLVANIKETTGLSEKEKERLMIEEKIATAKAEGLMSAKELLLYEIQLYENATFYNSEKEKEQKLAELRINLKAEEVRLESEISGTLAKREDFEKRFNILRESSVLTESEILKIKIAELEASEDLYHGEEKLIKIKDLNRQLEEAIARETFAQLKNREKYEIDRLILELKQSQRYTEEELLVIQAELIANSQYQYDNIEKQNELYQLQLELLSKMAEKSIEFGNEFRSQFQNSLAELLKGEITVEDFFTKLRDKLIDMWASAMAENITNMIGGTGIFGGIGDIFARISGAGKGFPGMYEGGMVAGEVIKDQMIMGGQAAAQAIASAMAGGVPTGAGAYIPTMPMFGGFGGIGYPTITGGYGGIFTGYQMTPKGIAPTWSPYGAGGLNLPTWLPFNQLFSKLGKPLGSFWGGLTPLQLGFAGLLGGYMGYQTGGVMGGIGMGIGSILMAAGHPLLALPFLFMGLFGGKKKSWTQSSWEGQPTPEVIPLEIAGGIAPLPSIYPLPESRYFAMPRFGRVVGGIQININIGEISGTNEEIANQIAEKVADIYNRDLKRGLNIIYP